jgi:hypothetical protein
VLTPMNPIVRCFMVVMFCCAWLSLFNMPTPAEQPQGPAPSQKNSEMDTLNLDTFPEGSIKTIRSSIALPEVINTFASEIIAAVQNRVALIPHLKKVTGAIMAENSGIVERPLRMTMALRLIGSKETPDGKYRYLMLRVSINPAMTNPEDVANHFVQALIQAEPLINPDETPIAPPVRRKVTQPSNQDKTV